MNKRFTMLALATEYVIKVCHSVMPLTHGWTSSKKLPSRLLNSNDQMSLI